MIRLDQTGRVTFNTASEYAVRCGWIWTVDWIPRWVITGWGGDPMGFVLREVLLMAVLARGLAEGVISIALTFMFRLTEGQ